MLRDWHLLCVCASGITEIAEVGAPVVLANGASNFFARLNFFIDGIPQEANSGLTLWSLPFGDVFGTTYIIAQEGQTIEMRLTMGLGAVQATASQVLMAMHGNLLQAKGYQPQFEPGTDVSIPVHNQAVTELAV